MQEPYFSLLHKVIFRQIRDVRWAADYMGWTYLWTLEKENSKLVVNVDVDVTIANGMEMVTAR